MKLECSVCHKVVSTEIPDETVVRAHIVCTSCLEKEKDELKATLEIIRPLIAQINKDRLQL